MTEVERAPTELEVAALPLPSLLVDSNTGTILAANAPARRLLDASGPLEGRDFRAVVGRDPNATIHPSSSDIHVLAVGGHSRAVRLWPSEVRYRGRPGMLVQVEEVLAPEVVLDQLGRLEARFRTVADQVPGAVFEYRLRPDGTDEVTYMSSGCFDLWELPPDAIEHDATPLWQMTHAEDLQALERSVMESARTMAPWSHEWRILTPSGNCKHLRAAGRPREEPDGSTAWSTVAIDITEYALQREERMRLEQQLRQAARMESIGRLAGGIAHDFNNMLTVILGSAGAAAELDLPPEAAELLAEIVSAGRKSADLTSKLLSFSRVRAVEPRPTSLHDHLLLIAPLLQRLIGDRTRLTVDADPEIGPIRIDTSELDQILTNLVANAHEALEHHGGGTVTVGCHRDGEAAILVVEDDGPGISDELEAHMFEPFFSTKTGQNTGLGLATVYATVSRAGGTVELERPAKRGVRFVMRFPTLDLETLEPASAPAPVATKGRPIDVLIVDDDPQVRLVLTRLSESMGYVVRNAADGQAALELLEATAQDVDVVLADIDMPGMDGWELSRTIRDRWPQVGVVLMSGFSSQSAADTNASGVPRLEKPFERAQLERALRAALQDRSLE